MKISLILVFVIAVMSAFIDQTEARWKGWKKIEKAGQRVFKAAEKALPVATGYAAIGRRR
nr:cecropin [Lasioderma serricorne]